MSQEIKDNSPVVQFTPQAPQASIVNPNQSVEKLNSLSFDPIQRLVNLHDRIDKEIYELQYMQDGTARRKFSQVAFVQLMGIQQKISADLMRYGYARVQEVQKVEAATLEPIKIILT